MKIIAHRGGSEGKLPQNSLEAISSSLENNVASIELDVWIIDHKAVITHGEPSSGKDYPDLLQVLKLVSGQSELILEIKNRQSAKETLSLVKKNYKNHMAKVVFTSFDKETLKELRQSDKSIRLGVNWRGIDNFFMDFADDIKAEFVAFNWKRVPLNYFNIKQSREMTDLSHLAYTVNSKSKAKFMKTLGIDGIFTDFPNRFKN